MICVKLLNQALTSFFSLELNIGLLIFHVVTEPQNSAKSAKSREIHKNKAKFIRNRIKYMSVQHFLKLISAIGAIYLP